MKMYIGETIERFLDDLASEHPTPGGGSSAALSGAMGAALASMVCRLTMGKEAYANVQLEIKELLIQTEDMRHKFQQLIQEDIEAYGRLSASFKLPRETIEERTVRANAIQNQLVEAALVPLEVTECSAELIECCQRIAEIGNSAVLSDVATGSILALSAGEGAAFMVRINLSSVKDDNLVSSFRDRLNIALVAAAVGVQRVKDIVGNTA